MSETATPAEGDPQVAVPGPPEFVLAQPAAPAFYAALAFAGGIVSERFIQHPAWLWLTAIVSLAAATAFFVRRRPLLARAVVLVVFVYAGAFTAQCWQSVATPASPLLIYADGSPLELTGYVVRDGSLRNSASTDPRETLDFAVEQIARLGEAPVNVAGTARISIFQPKHGGLPPEFADSADPEQELEGTSLRRYSYGERLHLTAKLHEPLNYRNPGNMDFVGYLRQQGVSVVGSAKSTEITLLSGRGGTRIAHWRSRARASILAHIHHLWTEPAAGLFDAMLLGERGNVNREKLLEFQRSSTFHLLVVSGLNVSVFAAFLYWLFRRLSARTEWAVIFTVLITVGYAWLTDLGAPILRSVLMVGIAQLTGVFYRERNALNGVGVAALALLAWEPHQLFEASFQLTFLAVVVIAGVAVPVIERTSQPRHRALDQLWVTALDPQLPPDIAQFRDEIRLLSTKLANILPARIAFKIIPGFLRCCFGLWELIVVSVLMQFAMALPTAWYFHRIAVHGVWANMAVIPLTALLMPSSVLAVTLAYVAPWLAKPLAWIAYWSLAGISGTVHVLGGTGVHDVRVALPSTTAVAAAFIAVSLAILLARRHRWLCVTGVAALALSAIAVYSSHRPLAHPAQKLELTAIDIGQGDSLLLITPQGRTLLLDSGGPAGFVKTDFDIGEDVVSPYLWERGIDHLDAVAFSHAHSDHVGGMRAVIRNFHPDEIWLAPNLPTKNFLELMQTATDEHTGAVVRRAGEQWSFGGAEFRALAPLPGWELKPKDQDDNSFVLRVTCGNASALLPGDMHKKLELALVESGQPLAADVLKVPHHGSATSSSEELLAAVHPRYALISCGRHNSYGHPRADVLARLAGVHANIYRTDLLGPVTFYLGSDGASVKIATSTASN